MLAISLFASLSIEYVGLLIGIHWIVMVTWLILPLLKSSFQLQKILSVMALGAAFIFVFINSEGSRTRRKYAFYYTISLVGNTAMMVMWFKHGSYPALTEIPYWLYYLCLVGHYVFFFIGIVFLVLYHAVGCHPERSTSGSVSTIDIIRLNAQ